MNDTVTILGRVGSDPNRSQTGTGVPVISFRVASPQSRYDSRSQSWVETGTNWYSVSAYRQLAEHAKASLRIGDGVIITGRLKLREWESGGRKGMSADIDADAIGHDLRWGASAFVKAPSAAAPRESAHDPAADDALARDAGLEPIASADRDGGDSSEARSDEAAMALATGPADGWDPLSE